MDIGDRISGATRTRAGRVLRLTKPVRLAEARISPNRRGIVSQPCGLPSRGGASEEGRGVIVGELRNAVRLLLPFIEAFTPLVAAAKDPQEAQKYFDQMMYYVEQAKLPASKRKRLSYPRAVWGKGESLPHRRE
jgi:hypothetical protein